MLVIYFLTKCLENTFVAIKRLSHHPPNPKYHSYDITPQVIWSHYKLEIWVLGFSHRYAWGGSSRKHWTRSAQPQVCSGETWWVHSWPHVTMKVLQGRIWYPFFVSATAIRPKGWYSVELLPLNKMNPVLLLCILTLLNKIPVPHESEALDCVPWIKVEFDESIQNHVVKWICLFIYQASSSQTWPLR